MNKMLFRLSLVLMAAAAAASCGGEDGGPGGLGAVDKVAEELAKSCGIDINCEAGIVDGNASISGVASVDAFFQSVINFRGKADNVSSEIEAQLQAIRGDFGLEGKAAIGTELMAKLSA